MIALNIVYFSTVPWRFLWSRPQQIVSRLADRGHSIIFFQNPIYLDPSGLARNYREIDIFAIKEKKKNLYLVNMRARFKS